MTTALAAAAAPITGLSQSTKDILATIALNVVADPANYEDRHLLADYEANKGGIAFHHFRLKATDRVLKNRVKKHKDSGEPNGVYDTFYKAAQKDLGLDDEQALRLLGGVYRWPKRFMDRYLSAKSPKARATALARRIEYFIETDGNDSKPRGRKKELTANA